MFICICNGVTERHIETAVKEGAVRMRDLRHQLGVTQDCSKCAQSAHNCLKAALQRHATENNALTTAITSHSSHITTGSCPLTGEQAA